MSSKPSDFDHNLMSVALSCNPLRLALGITASDMKSTFQHAVTKAVKDNLSLVTIERATGEIVPSTCARISPQ